MSRPIAGSRVSGLPQGECPAAWRRRVQAGLPAVANPSTNVLWQLPRTIVAIGSNYRFSCHELSWQLPRKASAPSCGGNRPCCRTCKGVGPTALGHGFSLISPQSYTQPLFFRFSGYFPWIHVKFICKGERKWSFPGLCSMTIYALVKLGQYEMKQHIRPTENIG